MNPDESRLADVLAKTAIRNMEQNQPDMAFRSIASYNQILLAAKARRSLLPWWKRALGIN